MTGKNLKLKQQRRRRRKLRVRKRVFGTDERPRLTVFRSHRHISAQIINDLTGTTLVQASTLNRDLRQQVPRGGNRDAAAIVGRALAERALARGIRKVVFDRNGYKYHGRIAALAEAARKAGLEF